MADRDLLAVNDAFYRAFRAHDPDAMDALWAPDGPVACIHPGWGALNDRTRIMSSWQAIFDAPTAPDIVCVAPRAYDLGDVGFVICFEQIGETCLIATNIFSRRDGTWKIVHHQAGPTSVQPEAAADGTASGGSIH